MPIRRLTPLALALGLVPIAVNPPPAHAAFPGTNGVLAFQLEAPAGDHTQTDIYTIQPSGSGLKQLTATPDQHEFGPAWNAAGTRIAFWRTPAPFGTGSVWTMKPDGTDQRPPTTAVDARDPAWNPPRTPLVFTPPRADGFDPWTHRAAARGDRQRRQGRLPQRPVAGQPHRSRPARGTRPAEQRRVPGLAPRARLARGQKSTRMTTRRRVGWLTSRNPASSNTWRAPTCSSPQVITLPGATIIGYASS